MTARDKDRQTDRQLTQQKHTEAVKQAETTCPQDKNNTHTHTLKSNTHILDDVLEGIVGQTAIAALVARAAGTVHQLLLGARHQLAAGNLMRALHRPRRGERPARPALALVLHGADCALCTPVHVAC